MEVFGWRAGGQVGIYLGLYDRYEDREGKGRELSSSASSGKRRKRRSKVLQQKENLGFLRLN